MSPLCLAACRVLSWFCWKPYFHIFLEKNEILFFFRKSCLPPCLTARSLINNMLFNVSHLSTLMMLSVFQIALICFVFLPFTHVAPCIFTLLTLAACSVPLSIPLPDVYLCQPSVLRSISNILANLRFDFRREVSSGRLHFIFHWWADLVMHSGLSQTHSWQHIATTQQRTVQPTEPTDFFLPFCYQ